MSEGPSATFKVLERDVIPINIQFKKESTLKEIFASYANKMQSDLYDLEFYFNGQKVDLNSDLTFKSLIGNNNSKEIEINVPQFDGGLCETLISSTTGCQEDILSIKASTVKINESHYDLMSKIHSDMCTNFVNGVTASMPELIKSPSTKTTSTSSTGSQRDTSGNTDYRDA